MPDWNQSYYGTLEEKFQQITTGLGDRLEDVVNGRVAPSVEDLSIGTGRSLRSAVFFFDIRGFSNRTGSPELSSMKDALYLLDCVIPMVMHAIFDHGGYVEKNTGDGVMALIPTNGDDKEATSESLSIATTIFYLLNNLVNPHLVSKGIAPVDARIGIDLGPLLLARIGTPTGTARHERNFITAVGPAANLACRLQQMAGTNQIWVGDLIKRSAEEYRQPFFEDVTPGGWTWTYKDQTTLPYRIWNYNARRNPPS